MEYDIKKMQAYLARAAAGIAVEGLTWYIAFFGTDEQKIMVLDHMNKELDALGKQTEELSRQVHNLDCRMCPESASLPKWSAPECRKK